MSATEPPTTAPPLVEEDDTPDNNVFEKLRQERQQIADNRETFIPIEVYVEQPLLVRYSLIDGHAVDNIARKVERATKSRWERALYTSIDIMCLACTGLFVPNEEEDGEPIPLTLRGQPVEGFGDSKLIQGFQMSEVKSARQVVMYLFGGNDVAIGKHSAQLQRWMSNTSVSVDSEFFGLPGE